MTGTIADYANSRKTKFVSLGCERLPFLNAPLNNREEARSDWGEVTDPAEPLFGRRFEVVLIARGDEAVAHVFVRYRDGIVLRVPLRSTSLSPLVDHTPRGKTLSFVG